MPAERSVTTPAWSVDGFICTTDLNRFRAAYVQSLLEGERVILTSLERSVVESLARHETLSENVDAAFQKSLTLGEPAGGARPPALGE